ncbi:MAG: BTAD domain-containing putative transcriptional regulator [Acidimicrobiia bacterium]
MDGLRIRMFGGLTLEAEGEQLPPIASRSGRSLLAYLIAHRHTAPTRDLLAGMFWPDMSEAQARRRLSHALWQIQSVLSEAGRLDGYIQASPTTIRFNADRGARVDVDEFDAALATLKDDGADLDRRTDTLDTLVGAVRLYTGDFLAGFYDDWIVVEQERLRQALFTILNHIVRLSKSWGDFDQALQYARRLALLDPLHEEAHREVMRLCYLLGRPNEALAQYERCASILASEIGAIPAAETVALREEIALGRQAPLVPMSEGSRSRLFEVDGTPLVGRAHERQEVIARMEDALAGRGGIVLLEGEAGAGKTRLLTECAEDANWRGLSVLWGASATVGVTRPFEGLRRALEDGLTELRVHQLRERMDGVWLQALAPLLPAVQRWAPDLQAGAALRGGTEERDRVREALHRTFVALAGLTPTMLVLDDLHQLDDDTLWALEALAGDLAETPLLICIAYRRLELESRPNQWQAVRSLDRSGGHTRIVLEALSPSEAGELVRRLMPESSSGSLISRLHADTGGNPLFILETLRALHERQVKDSLLPPTAVQTRDREQLPVSGTVFELISNRLGALPGEARYISWALAVSGTGMDIDDLAEVCELPRSQTLDAIDFLIQAGMISTARGKYAFSHHQLGRVAYQSMPADERPILHRRLAWQLERLSGKDPASLGHHFRLGAVPAQAARYLEEAGDEACRLSAYATARNRYSEALEQAEQASWQASDLARILFALEETLEVLADREGQYGLLDRLDRLVGDDADLIAKATRRRAWLLASVSRLDEAANLAAHALDLDAERADPVGRARDLLVLGTIAMWGSRHQEAIGWLESGLGLAPSASVLEADLSHVLSDALAEEKRFSEAKEQLDRARILYQDHHDQRGLAGATRSLAVLYGEMGDQKLVEPTLERAATLSDDIGYRYGTAMNALNLGHHHLISGQAARAIAPMERSRSVFAAIDNKRGLAMATANLASLRHFLGDDDAAGRESAEALDIFESLDHGPGAALCLGTLAEIARRRGDGGAARHLLASGLEVAAGPDGTSARLQLQRTEAHLLLDAGRLEEGLEVAQAARADCRQAQLEWLLPDVNVPLARALVLLGEGGPALEVTSDNSGCAQEAELLYWRMRAFELEGDQAAAYAALEAAHRALRRRLDGLSGPDISRSIEDVPLNRDLEAAWQAGRPRRATVRLAAIGAPTGRAVEPSDLIEVEWTIHHPLDELQADGPARRGRQLLRLTAEAEAVEAAPTISDLAQALGVSPATTRRDIEALRKAGHSVYTRGRRQ